MYDGSTRTPSGEGPSTEPHSRQVSQDQLVVDDETKLDYDAVWSAVQAHEKIADQCYANGSSVVPDESLPPIGALGFRVQRYGILKWRDLFAARQRRNVSLLMRAVCELKVDDEGETLRTMLAFAVDKFARHCNGNARWNNVIESVEPAFGQQTLPITWFFPESVPLGQWAENFEGAYEAIAQCVERGFAQVNSWGEVSLCDARRTPLPDESSDIWFVDPPYYNAIGYADLSDFFFVWLKRSLPGSRFSRDPFDPNNAVTPKAPEIVQDQARMVDGSPKDAAFFEAGMFEAFTEGRRILKDDGVGCVVFAHKTTQGWEALLSGLIRSGWTITASWPLATERAGRLRARDSAALGASVHLICRPRIEDNVGDWADVLRELPPRVAEWMQRLQSEGVRRAGLVFACIGPALEIYSRYARVETADGREVSLAEYLEKVWEVVGRVALQQVLGGEGDAGALEEDARLVALFLWTLQSTAGLNGAEEAGASDDDEADEAAEDDDDEEETGSSRKAKGYTLVYDVVRRFAQPLGIHLEDWERRIIETKKGTVRLLPVPERAKQLFGEDGAEAAADQLETPGASPQLSLFPEVQAVVKPKRGRKKVMVTAGDDVLAERRGATTLDRVHAAMLLQQSGRANALRTLLAAEVERGPEFLRLANSLSALYPRESEEKRLLDAMLLAVPR